MENQETAARFQTEYDALTRALSGEDLESVRRAALDAHARTHPAEVSGGSEPTIADRAFAFLRDGGRDTLVPRQIWDTDLHYAGTAEVPAAWLFWHTYRIEDLVSNILIADGEQIFNRTWQKRIGASITDTGNALTLREAKEFCGGLDLDALWDYMIEVGKNTRRVIGGMNLERMRSMSPEETVMRILEEGGVTNDFRSVWLLVFWGRLTGAGMIRTPLTMHHMMHLPVIADRMP